MILSLARKQETAGRERMTLGSCYCAHSNSTTGVADPFFERALHQRRVVPKPHERQANALENIFLGTKRN
jgi:hypothetical protein